MAYRWTLDSSRASTALAFRWLSTQLGLFIRWKVEFERLVNTPTPDPEYLYATEGSTLPPKCGPREAAQYTSISKGVVYEKQQYIAEGVILEKLQQIK